MRNHLDQAIEIVQRAIDYDNAHNYAQASKEYVCSLDYFMLALKYEKNPQIRLLIKNKVEEYLHRAETIKTSLTKSSSQDETGTTISENRKEDSEIQRLRLALSEVVLTETPNITWDDIAGLDKAKMALKEAVILPIRYPQLFTGKRLPWKGILLYGPPGTGKSELARAIATEAKSTFFSVSSSDLVSKWQGESERHAFFHREEPLNSYRLVKQLFQMARELKPSIIFIDEIDSLTTARGDTDSESSRRIKTEFLVQMDGVGRDAAGVLVLGATNVPWSIDPSVRRRFERRIYVPLPDLPARRRMFEIHIGATPSELTPADYKTLAKITENFSGADISIFVHDALMQPVRKFISASHFRPVVTHPDITKWAPCSSEHPEAVQKSWMDIQGSDLFEPSLTIDDFMKSLESVRPSVSQADVERHDAWTSEFGS